MQGTVGLGAGTAALWSAPTMRSVRPLQAAGSPPPSPSTTDVTVGPGGTVDPTTSTTTTTTPTTSQQDPRDPTVTRSADPLGTGNLPLTGVEAVQLAALGGGAVMLGRALMAARGRMAAPVDEKYGPSAEQP